MLKQGRKSHVESNMMQIGNMVQENRVKPFAHMTDAEIAVWNEVVNDQPAGAFTEVHKPLLEMYCRHVINNRVISDEILNFDRSWIAEDDGLKRYEKLLNMAEKESRAASSLATRLRITRQAIDHNTVARQIVNAPKAKKPWQLPDAGDE